MEPSIGNNDEEFCSLWFQRLEEFSLTLITDIIEYSEKIENATAIKIDEETAYIKSKMRAKDFADCTDQLDQNSTQRRKRLSISKKKKYHHLRYNRPDKQEQKRPERPARNFNHSDDEPDRNNRFRETKSNRNLREFGDDRRSNRRNNYYSDDEPERTIRFRETVPKRNSNEYGDDRRNRGSSNSNYTDDESERTRFRETRPRTNQYEDDVHNHRTTPKFGNRTDRRTYQQDDDASNYQRNDRRSETENNRQVRGDYPRNPPSNESYRDMLIRSRHNSRTSLVPKRSNNSLSRRGSRNDLPPSGNRNFRGDSEPEDTQPGREQRQPKNVKAPIGGAPTPSVSGPSSRKTNQEMMDFIAATMLNLENFRKQLTN